MRAGQSVRIGNWGAPPAFAPVILFGAFMVTSAIRRSDHVWSALGARREIAD